MSNELTGLKGMTRKWVPVNIMEGEEVIDTIRVYRVKVKDFPSVLKAVGNILSDVGVDLGNKENSLDQVMGKLKDPAAFLQSIATRVGDLTDIVELLTNLDKEQVEDLDADIFIDVVACIISANMDFFLSRLPSLLSNGQNETSNAG